ncbi:lipoteichoic acid synthase 2 [Paraliobacillus ryukyuensis]|uniref:Phosphoglycerol transferase MdoB-like AlkP superfamily enzyme n=1 Tax=Paraliobacillus ryukyuensis TaxID=200904 RepID=A0A366EG76_9BACI|nr:LTA synthase family protein [Paraliobacillus ryukyuensis]RBP01402.1 phosphoglycerol transferase MdoB-like AlkP superfamily enzyme [Paraliobacillus ryukyuensis]
MFYQNRKIPLYVIASLLFGLKTYIVYRFIFNIELDNAMQEIILFINPFVSAFLVFALSIWFKEKRQLKFTRYAMLIGSLILYFNLVFYRNFTDFLTIPVLFQGSNAADLGSSVMALIHIPDILLFLDVAIVWYLSKKYGTALSVSYHKRNKVLAFSLSIAFLMGNYILAEIERPQLLQRTFDREYLVKNIGIFNYHIYDIVQQSKSKAQRVFADGNELAEIEDYINNNTTDNSKSDMFGIAKDKNVIFISLESMQSFVINNTLHGEEITPFLNDLVEDSYYFENFYHQTEQGKTSDSEFLVETGLYPLPSGAVFFTHGQNEYNSTTEILKNNGYTSNVFHANNKSFWNRDVMYDNLGIDKFYDVESYDVNDENSVGWGLKDKPFFDQSIKYLEDLPEPYYSRFITLTNHYPFDLDPEDATIDKFDSNSKTLNQYFQTVRYTDEAIKEFFSDLKASGEYEDSIIVLMGDHYGISDFHDKAMAQYLDKEEITPYDHIQLQRVPFIIHIPGQDGKVMSEVAGQIDVKPTLTHLLGIDDSDDLSFGTDLFGENRKGYIALRDGSFISNDYIYTKDQCFNRSTGELIAAETEGITDDEHTKQENACQPIEEKVAKELSYSDQIIYGDLFRFHDFKNENEETNESKNESE